VNERTQPRMLSSARRRPAALAGTAALLLVAAARACTEAGQAEAPQLTILASLPFVSLNLDQAHPHLIETLLALGENTRSPHVVEVRVVLDRHFPSPTNGVVKRDLHKRDLDKNATWDLQQQIALAQREHSERLDEIASQEQLQKIQAHVFGQQPTYAQLFRYANYALVDRIVVLTNADVVFRNFQSLDAGAFYGKHGVDPNFMLILAVRKPTGKFAETCEDMERVIDRCDNLAWSYDSYVFKSPITATARYDMLEEISPHPIYMNDNAAEHRVGAFLLMSGIAVYQACLYNFTEHWHCNQKMHHAKGNYNVEPVDGNPDETRMGFADIRPTYDFPGLKCGSKSSPLHANLLPKNWQSLVN